MNGWVKHFADGTKEIGTDRDVQMKKASWSHGRLTGMTAAEIIHENKKLSIMLPGDYWQSDDYDVSIFTSKPELIVRRLQFQIFEGLAWSFWENENELGIRRGAYTLSYGSIVGKWITLELDVRTGKMTRSIQENRI